MSFLAVIPHIQVQGANLQTSGIFALPIINRINELKSELK